MTNHSDMPPKPKSPNVLPDWWSFTFIAVQLAAMLPIAYKYQFLALSTFNDLLPRGYDLATDNLTSSLRVQLASTTSAQSALMIMMLFVGCTLFARNSLHGQPRLQQRLMKLPIYAGLMSDLWLYARLAFMVPREVMLDTSLWTSSISGLVYGLPFATLLKMLWLLGIGRDVV